MLNFNARSHVCVTQVTCRFVTLKIKGKQALPLYLLFDGEAQHQGLPAYCHLKTAPFVCSPFLPGFNDSYVAWLPGQEDTPATSTTPQHDQLLFQFMSQSVQWD